MIMADNADDFLPGKLRELSATVADLQAQIVALQETRERLARAEHDVLIMHPGPMNRGVEIDSDVADGPHSVILNQVTNGVAVRMAVLYLLAGGKPELAEAAKGGSGGDR